MNLNWSRGARWAALTAAGICTITLVLLVVTNITRSVTGFWATLFVLAIGIIAAAAALLSKDTLPPGERRAHALLKPKPLSILFLAILGGLGAMTTAQSVLGDGSSTTENQLQSIAEIGNTLLIRTDPTPPTPPRIRLRLAGLWGEKDCPVIYRIQLRDQALTMDSVREPPGRAPYHFVGTIISAEGDVMELRGERPPEARGAALTLTYGTNGVVEQLTWDDQTGSVPLELGRCP